MKTTKTYKSLGAALLLILTMQGYAADVKFLGTVDNDLANGLNWTGGVIPPATDSGLLDGTLTPNVYLDTNFNTLQLKVERGAQLSINTGGKISGSKILVLASSNNAGTASKGSSIILNGGTLVFAGAQIACTAAGRDSSLILKSGSFVNGGSMKIGINAPSSEMGILRIEGSNAVYDYSKQNTAQTFEIGSLQTAVGQPQSKARVEMIFDTNGITKLGTNGRLQIANVPGAAANPNDRSQLYLDLSAYTFKNVAETIDLIAYGTLDATHNSFNQVWMKDFTSGDFVLWNVSERFDFGNGAFATFDYGTGANSAVSITLTAVPEPAEVAAIIALLAMGFAIYRRRNS